MSDVNKASKQITSEQAGQDRALDDSTQVNEITPASKDEAETEGTKSSNKRPKAKLSNDNVITNDAPIKMDKDVNSKKLQEQIRENAGYEFELPTAILQKDSEARKAGDGKNRYG